MNWASMFRAFGRSLVAAVLVAALGCVTASAVPTARADSGTATYSATQTIPVPPASNYAGAGGGDGWSVALNNTQVFNVFHHQSQMTVACHLQSDASECWSPRTVREGTTDFATSGHSGAWLDPITSKLYAFGTRTSDMTGGVVCIDTVLAATNPNPFCGFTPLTAPGESTGASRSAIGAPARVGGKVYAFNFVSGSTVTGAKNKLLCFDTSTLAACAGQPFTVTFAPGTNSNSDYPPPGTAAIGSRVVMGATFGGAEQLGCFDTATMSSCGGSWPAAISSYNSAAGAPFPMLSPVGDITGVCLPTATNPCFDLSGASVPTPAGMTTAIGATSGWSGSAFTLGPRVYVPNGNSDSVQCYNASTAASCVGFPKALSNLNLLYTVNPDPQRPTCIWVNADGGSAQIQNFDAYTGGPCGEGAIRVLAASFVASAPECTPSSFQTLQVLDPGRAAYSTGTIAFQDNDAQPIPGIPDKSLDDSGSVDLSGLNLSTALGLPQFVITLNGGSGTPSAVTVRVTWTGADNEACLTPGVTKTTTETAEATPMPIAAPPAAPVSARPTYTG